MSPGRSTSGLLEQALAMVRQGSAALPGLASLPDGATNLYSLH